MRSIFQRRGKYDQDKKQTNKNKKMYIPKNLTFGKGGSKFSPNGYDVINEQMFNDIQRLNIQLAMEDEARLMRDAQNLANQRKGLAKKVLSPNVYDYIDKNLMNTPELRRLVNPYTMVANQQYQMGGMQEMPQMQSQQMGQDQQIMQMVMQALQQGQDPQQIMQMLVEQGIPQEQAQMILQEVMAQMQQPQMQEEIPMQKMGGMRPKGLSFDY